MAQRPLERYHERTRRRGVNPFVYWPVRWVIKPAILLYFRLRRLGTEHIPDGGVVLASNHRSFLDPFAIGCCIGRPIYFVAKRELFRKPLLGWFLNCLGAFPIKRGASDEESMATARALLERGQAVVIFPEGTRIRTGSLARPKRGVGRLALESGKPVVPIAVTNSERVRDGWRIRPVRVHIRCGPPITFPRVENPSPFLAGEVTERIWPCVELQWEWLGGLPPLRTAAVVGAGSMGTAAAAVLARAGLAVQLGCRTSAQAEALRAGGENTRYMPGLAIDKGIDVKTVPEIEFAGVDLVVLAVPCAALPVAVGEIGARTGDRSAVLVASKGLVPPFGTTPAAFVSERVRARAVASLAGPAHAREAIELGAAVVVATHDVHLRRQLRDVLEAGGLTVQATDDVTGAELASCAKNAAALAGAAAAPRGANLAGAAAGHVFSEVHDLAVATGGRSETFAGLAGAGDLLATAIAEGSRNRRAGELVGAGVPAGQVQASMDQTAESLATVPLLAQALAREGIDAPVTMGLRRVLDGELTPEQWLESVRSARQPQRRTHAA
ncbi:MAG TPA: 1-acyl-sn-glycerol-3-phosphate acyltransferase [Thermoleophilaceae bacterium]|jgi:1-acyl-sn-glycerol-3-phosphate acyltransferase|nr:1-acyl-sn-glycerol-3-phosphate acyltransferase [Thermoleophilaceae bacterium]